MEGLLPAPSAIPASAKAVPIHRSASGSGLSARTEQHLEKQQAELHKLEVAGSLSHSASSEMLASLRDVARRESVTQKDIVNVVGGMLMGMAQASDKPVCARRAAPTRPARERPTPALPCGPRCRRAFCVISHKTAC